jgi:hypothetical protein
LRRTALAMCLLALIGLVSGATAEQTVRFNNMANQVNLIQQDQDGFTVQLNIGSIDFVSVSTDSGEFALPVAKGLARSQDIGNPELPLANKLIAVPLGCQLRAEVLNSEVEEISLADYGVTAPLMPAQPSLSKSVDASTVPFEFNRGTYLKSGYYQLPVVSTDIDGIMRGVRVGLVSIAPVQYNPTENKLKVNTSLEVRVNFEHADWARTHSLFDKTYSPAFEPIYQLLFNYDNTVYRTREDLTRYPMKMIIISDRMFETQLQPFITWKTEKGFIVDVAYTDEIGATTTAIHNYIATAYGDTLDGDPPPSFVLFVGDTPQIPAYSGSAGSHITDLRYCELTGDNLPEIYWGRMCAQSPAQLQPQIDKTLEYEQYTMPDPSYLQEVTLIAGVDPSHAPTYGNGQINYGTDNYFNLAHGIIDHTWLYPASDDPGASAAIIQTVDDGVGFINYTAHGDHSLWANPSFTVSDINNLTNAHKYNLAVGNCCLTSTFGESTPCFGEAWLQKENGGGIGYIGGTNSTYWDEDYWWGVGFKTVTGDGPPYDANHLGAYDGMFHDHGEPVSEHYVTNYGVVMAGNLAVEQSSSTRKEYYWEIYNVLGDPSVMTYLGEPSENTVSHNATMLLTATSFTVEADPGSYVALSYDGVLHGAGYVDETGAVDVPIAPFGTPVPAEIVVTCQNRIPYVSTVQVISPEGPYVIHASHTVNDASGNNNGLVDFGESILLGVALVNVGPATAENVNATLQSQDMYVDITDATEYYGTIDSSSSDTVNIDDAFAFNVSPLTPDGHRIPFQLVVTGQERDTVWTSQFNIDAHAPSVGYVSVQIDDASGDNNGIFDPGETVDLIVTLDNSGSGQAYNVSATLDQGDQYVTTLDDNGYFGNIAASGGTADNSGDVFTLEADTACPMGHYLTCTLDVTGDGGYTASLNFNLTVGHKVPFFTEDFSLEQGWTGLGTSAEWEIGAAGGLGGDPSEDHTPGTDNYVLGNDLTTNGQYNSSIGQTYWVESPEIDCSEITAVEMTYYHQLGVESSTWDHAYLEAFDGVDWVQLFANGGSTITETSWTQDVYDLSAIADNNPFFKIRFGLGPTDGSGQYCGWNIDDIELKGYVSGLAGTAAMEYTPESLTDSLVEGQTSGHTISVTNVGEAALRVRFYPQASWIQCPGDLYMIESGNSVDVPVTIVSEGVAPGENTGALGFSSNDVNQSTGSIPATLYIYEPSASLDPTTISKYVESAGQDTVSLVITNSGPGRLNYSIAAQTNDTPLAKQATAVPLGFRTADPDKTAVQEPYYAAVEKGSGGPDAFGYTWIDSDEPGGPVFNWVDISSVGTTVTLGDDDSTAAIQLGFDFPYYDSTYHSVNIGSNGILTFSGGSTSLSNVAIPTSGAPNNMIAMWWDDLDPAEAGNIYYYQDAANSRFIVSFVGIRNYQYPSGTGSLTFQVILSSNGLITLQYQTMDPGDDSDGLAGSTVGIENLDGTDGLQVVYNATYMHDGLAIEFPGAAPRWLSVEPAAGSVDPMSSDTVDVLFDATELEDAEYTGQLLVTTNDLINPQIEVPVTLYVGQMPLPSVPDLLTPVNDTTLDMNTPTFSWSATAGIGGTYTLQHSQDETFENGTTTMADMTETSYTPETGMADGVWYWRVEAFNQAGGSGYQTQPCQFTIETFIAGDVNSDEIVNISDAVALIDYIFGGGAAPDPLLCGDCNCDEIVNISDATYLIGYIFGGGPAPCEH